MNDEELIAALELGDSYLEQYLESIKPVLVELSKRKEHYTGYKYVGEFGCWESGIEDLCIHIADSSQYREIDYSPYKWRDTVAHLFSGVNHIYLGGHR